MRCLGCKAADALKRPKRTAQDTGFFDAWPVANSPMSAAAGSGEAGARRDVSRSKGAGAVSTGPLTVLAR
jgi:hypothetical protein